MEIHIRSFVPQFSALFDAFANALPKHSEIIWSFHRHQNKLKHEDLMELLIQGVDFILISANAIKIDNSNISVVKVFANPSNELTPLLLLALNGENKSLFSEFKHETVINYGTVDIVGFGPGNPELMTIKAQRLIREADVIFYDDLLDDAYLKQYKAELVYVGKRKGKHSAKQEQINELLFKAACKGSKVVRLKGGDPLVFGRGSEEYHYLDRRGVKVAIVPGITSALAAASEAVIPLTARGVSASVAFTLGHDAIYNKLPKADTLVFYMGASQQKAWAMRLMDEGWPENTPVACVRNASLASSETKRYTLGELLISEDILPAPALLIVGQTAGVELTGRDKKWLYTGFDTRYFKEKGTLVHHPLVEIKALQLTEKYKQILKNIRAFDRIVFATPFAVHQFFRALFDCGCDVRSLHGIEVNSIGTSTSKALKQYGLLITPASGDDSAEGLLEAISQSSLEQENILLPCSDAGLSFLASGLNKIAGELIELKLYESVLPDNAVRYNLDDFYGVVLTSPKAVKHFFTMYKDVPDKIVIKARGTLTRKLLNHYASERGKNFIIKYSDDISEVEA